MNPSAKTTDDAPYPEVAKQPDLPALERGVLAHWEQEGIFQASIDARPAGEAGSNEYVFYDGPPFANGLPHYGHLLTGYVKDIVPRYETMRGRRVERRFGWDCHGLPAELEAEKELDISGTLQILEHGIAAFNDCCRQGVYHYTREWQSLVTRMARWVDFENEYRTLDLAYMESVLWAFKTLFDKGLVYEGYRVMPYSWAVETPLSNFETRLDDSYRERQDPAITLSFRLAPTDTDPGPTELLAWTTTPWTLPSNLALAVGAEIDYAVFELDGRRVILGEATVAKYERELGDARRVGSIKGSELVDRRYEPLFPYFADRAAAGAFRVLDADFVDTEEGTGVVHMAPGFGEEDMAACQRAGIDVVCPVDSAGRFTAEVTDYAGANVLEANTSILRDLKLRGVVLRHETYLHNYPHCWRTDTPLIYRAVSSWFLKVTEIRDRMVELNQQIYWVPAHVKDGIFGKWLEGARDWSLSRNRFWGAPIPIWKSDDPAFPRVDVYGSLDELERDFGVRPTDLHRPWIDELTRPNPDDPSGKSTMRRVPEVLDCWFESGSMPYAQVHYPFENREWFDNHFPADFIVEYVAQTRGWFYTMVVLATALFDKPPFRNCICHGIILDEDGRKLSKRLRNYPDPKEVFETTGSDALRWFLCSSPILKGADLQIDREGSAIAECVRLVLHPIWNAYAFFCLYANSDSLRARRISSAENLLDRYALAKARELVTGVTAEFEAYDLPGACRRVAAFLDALNNWYVRRSRERFWRARDAEDPDKQAAYDTLHTVLETLCRVAAPLLPLLCEGVWRGLTGGKSVHLTDWPDTADLPEDAELVADMDRARAACSVALALREEQGLRVRQPLRSMTVAGPGSARLRPFFDLVRAETNVHDVLVDEDITAHATRELKLNARSLGPKLGARMKDVLAKAKAGEWSERDGEVEVAGLRLEPADFELVLRAREGLVCAALQSGDAVVLLDTELDDALVAEGRARDLVRVVQQARKEAGLDVSDRIELRAELPEDWNRVERFTDYVQRQTLATGLEIGPLSGSESGWFDHEASIAGATLRVALRRQDEQ